MTCVIVNRNYPPDAGITGHSANELAGFLEDNGTTVEVVTVAGRYAGGVSGGDAPIRGRLHHISKVYNGKNKVLRLLGSLIEGRRLAKKAISLRPNVLIGLTDPPLVNYWISKFAARAKLPWIYWSMDLYPEAFAAAGLTSKANWIYRYLADSFRLCPPAHLVALGGRQAEHIQRDLGENIPTSLLPCGIATIHRSPESPSWHPGPGKIVLGYVGNLGEAHDPEFVISVIRALDPDLHGFILAVYGVHAGKITAAVSHLPCVTIVNQVDRADLGWIDIHLTSLKPHWDHICVPSKAVSAVCAGSTLLSCCSEQTDNWQLLRDAGWRIEPGGDYTKLAASWVESLNPESLRQKMNAAAAITGELLGLEQRSFENILAAVVKLTEPPMVRSGMDKVNEGQQLNS